VSPDTEPERLGAQADRLEPGVEEAEAVAKAPPAVIRARDAAKPSRLPLPDHLPRRIEELPPSNDRPA
jgi:hypothetical protein